MKLKIYEKRREKGMSLRMLAQKSGLSLASLCRYEDGTVDIPLRKLINVAKALDCKYTDLVLLDDAKE